MFKSRKLTNDEELLAVELYQSSSRDVDRISAELWELQGQYNKARKMARIGTIADKFDLTIQTMSKILKQHGVQLYTCPTRVHLTK